MQSNYKAANIFSDVKVESFPRHVFDKSYTNSFTCNHGYAIPVFVDDVIPGDRIELKSYGRVQLQPLATASMQNIKCYIRYFYVPYRILWEDWDKFISQDGFSTETAMLAPYVTIDSSTMNNITSRYKCNSLLEYLGVNFSNWSENQFVPKAGSRISFTLFRHLAYNKIWNRYFRDENIQEEVSLFYDSELLPGDNTLNNVNGNAIVNFLPVAYEKDYFTTALPWTQKGEPVSLGAFIQGIGAGTVDNTSVRFTSEDSTEITNANWRRFVTGYDEGTQSGGGGYTYANAISSSSVNAGDPVFAHLANPSVTIQGTSLSTSVNINELRYANALQRYLERLALGGNRPAEFYLSMYGVKIDDLRIGDPLYLGGGSTYIHVNQVTQMSESANTPLATLAGNGVATPSMEINEPYYCQEFGVVMGIMYLRPEINYSQGIAKETQLFGHLDYYNPVFAHLGEEPVMTSELYADSTLVIDPANPEFNNDDIFGYQSRYAYRKARRNEVHGELKSDLSTWLLSANFSRKPRLNSDFITVDQNYDIFAVVDENLADHYICELHHDYKVESSMPDFAIPSL